MLRLRKFSILSSLEHNVCGIYHRKDAEKDICHVRECKTMPDGSRRQENGKYLIDTSHVLCAKHLIHGLTVSVLARFKILGELHGIKSEFLTEAGFASYCR
jgi:hypothetical protein